MKVGDTVKIAYPRPKRDDLTLLLRVTVVTDTTFRVQNRDWFSRETGLKIQHPNRITQSARTLRPVTPDRLLPYWVRE